jgi:hypothetical protein
MGNISKKVGYGRERHDALSLRSDSVCLEEVKTLHAAGNVSKPLRFAQEKDPEPLPNRQPPSTTPGT